MSKAQAIDTRTAARPMTVQIMKTKAETELADQLAEAERRLPGGDWLRQLRRAAIGAFTAEGLPHRRLEEWKFTDLRALLREAFPLAAADALETNAAAPGESVKAALPDADLSKSYALFVDGKGAAATGIPTIANADVPFLSALIDHPPTWLQDEITDAARLSGDGALALNTALFSDGAVIDIADGAEVADPIALIFTDGAAMAPRAIVSRNVIRVGKGAKATIIECHVCSEAPRQSNTLTQLVIEDGAEVTHIKVVATTEGSLHLGRTLARLGAKAAYRPFQMTVGSGVVRNDIGVTFRGQHSTFDLGAALVAAGRGHADTTLVVDHAVPHCTSRELVKCVLADRTRGVFQGKVIVRPDAQKTDGKQMAQALMLSEDAEFDSKPELEIYADDVVCGHGSTSAELDEELVFYLCSRGIPADEAKALLVEAFVGEAIDKVEAADINAALKALARSWLNTAGPSKAGT
jgi:Fe-S cluster assembly protein SufD